MPAKIVAIVTVKQDEITGGAPTFKVDSEDELQKVAFSLEKILDSTAHDLKNGSIILVASDSKT